MLRYLHSLQVKDYTLDAGMIPLGSCTMKLNATTEMIPVTMGGFGKLHPFAPVEQAKGSGEAISLKPMTPFERKVVHDVVAAAGLASDSEGVEPRRYVVVRPA